MQKRKAYMLCGVTLLIVFGALTALGAIVKHEPTFYRQAHLPSSDDRKAQAAKFISNFGQMVMNMKQETWDCDITENQLNSFFEEQFMQIPEGDSLRKMGIAAPRVDFGDDSMRLGFRYGRGWFSTVISYDLKIWLVPKEPNVIAVEVLSARAGALPISTKTILQQLSDYAQNQNFRVTLYRKETNAVAVIELQQTPQPSSKLLTGLQVKTDAMRIKGKTLEHALALPAIGKAP